MLTFNDAIKDLTEGNWQKLAETSQAWAEKDKEDPLPKVLLFLAYNFIDPPKLSKALTVLEDLETKKRGIKVVLAWLEKIDDEKIISNPYFQMVISFLYSMDNSTVKRSVTLLEEALKKTPDCAEIYYQLGLSWGMPEKSISYYEKALKIKPSFPLAHYRLGINYQKLRLTDKAEESFKTAIKLSPDFAEAHYALGMLYDPKGKTEQSRMHLQKAAELDPEGATGKDAKAILEGKRQGILVSSGGGRKFDIFAGISAFLLGMMIGGFFRLPIFITALLIYLLYLAARLVLSRNSKRRNSG